MPKHDKPTATVTIGGKRVPILRAALIAQEAERLDIPPSKVDDVAIPLHAPTHVDLAGNRLTLHTAALIAERADEQGVSPRTAIQEILKARMPARAAKRTPPGKPRKR